MKENEVDQLILRLPVEDKDLVDTPNWLSQFVITKGNEDGNFRVDRDPKTNEGLLYVSKVSGASCWSHGGGVVERVSLPPRPWTTKRPKP